MKCVWENESEHECAHTHTHIHTHNHTHTHIQTYSDLFRLNLTITLPLTFTLNVLTHEKNTKKYIRKIQKKETCFFMHTIIVLWDSKLLFLDHDVFGNVQNNSFLKQSHQHSHFTSSTYLHIRKYIHSGAVSSCTL